MPKSRELLYLSFNEEEKKVLSYGIEFNEFILCLNERPKNILVLEGNYWGSEFDFTTRCEVCYQEDIDEFVAEEVYNYGDFSWVDYEEAEGLKSLTPLEVAELLYLGKLQRPVKSPFFDKLKNRYAYLAHDDGWRNLIYYRDLKDYETILNNLIVAKLKRIHDKSVMSLSEGVLKELVELSKAGLAIDFDRILEDKEADSFELKMYGLGIIQDMDKMYNNYERYKAKSSHNKSLEYIDNEWFIRDWW